MSAAALHQVYPSSPIKRSRRTAAEMDAVRNAILAIVLSGKGMTVRHLFYRLVGAGIVEKSEAAYNNVVARLATELRRSGDIPFGKIIDGSRLYSVPETYTGIADALHTTAYAYRRNYWSSADRTVEVWCEKDAIRALIQNVTWDLAVPLMVTRGFSSESVVQSLAVETVRSRKPKVILSLNDYDPSGALMLQDILRRAKHYAPDAVFVSEQVALTREQVEDYRLPTRPTKRDSNNHAARFGDDRSVELDAMEPAVLVDLLSAAIDRHIDPVALAAMQVTEESEREALAYFANTQGGRA